MSYIQFEMHSDYDSAECSADSDHEDGELRKCWLHHCKCKIERTVNPLECQSYRGNLLHCYRRDEQVQSVPMLISRKSLMSSLSQEPRASGTLAAMFSSGTKNQKTNSRILFSKTLIRQIGEDLFLMDAKIICSVRQDLKL